MNLANQINIDWEGVADAVPHVDRLNAEAVTRRHRGIRYSLSDYHAALAGISPESEPVTQRVACVLHSAVVREELTEDDAVKAWHGWCSRSTKYTESWAVDKWQYQRRYGDIHGGDVSTLYRYARDYPAPSEPEGDATPKRQKRKKFDESALPTNSVGLPYMPVQLDENGDPIDRRLFSRETMKNRDLKQAYFIPGLIAKGQVLGIIAAEKSFKTTTVIDLCYQLASRGGTWMGQLVEGGPYRVLFASGESNEAKMNETDEGIRRANEVDGTKPESGHMWITDRTFPFDSSEAKARLLGYLRHTKPDIFFLDPLYLSLPGDDINNSNVVGQLLNEIREYCDSEGVTFAIIHHTTKVDSKRSGAPKLVDASNGGVHRWLRQWILMGSMVKIDGDSKFAEIEMDIAGACAGQRSLRRYFVLPLGERHDDGVFKWSPQYFTREEYEAWKDTQEVGELDDKKEAIVARLKLYFSNAFNPPLSKTKTVQELFGLDRKSKKASMLFQRLVYEWNLLQEIDAPGRWNSYGPGPMLHCPDWTRPERKE